MKTFLSYLFVINLIFSQLALAQTKTEERSQTGYVLRQLPLGLVNLPFESFYRMMRSLGLDQWSLMQNSSEVKSILSKTQNLRTPTKTSAFPFENYDIDFEGVVDREFGVCSGFATLQRNFNLLMHFDPDNQFNQSFPEKNDRKNHFKFYSALVKEAASGRPVIIPGKRNLYELMLDPEIQKFTKELIVKAWAINNTTLQGIEQFAKHKKRLPPTSFKKLYDELNQRLKIGYNPIIYTSFPSSEDIKYNIHVIQVVKVSPFNHKTNSFDLYVWDDGVMKDVFGPFSPEKLLKVMSFRPNGKILWLESPEYLKLPLDEGKNNEDIKALWDKVLIDDTLWVDLLPNDDHVMSQLMINKNYWCTLNPEYSSFCE